MTNPVTLAIEHLGLTPLARACGVSYQAVRKWQRQGRFPRTEWTGETDYIGHVIEAAASEGKTLTRDQLLVVAPSLPDEAATQQRAA